MKKLATTTLLLSLNVFSASYVVEMKNTLSNKQINEIQKLKIVKAISKFTPYEGEYFDRLFSIETYGDKKEQLQKLSYVSLVEDDFEAEYFEIRQNPNSELLTNDLLFPLQWGLYNQDQIVSKKKVSGDIEETKGVRGFDIDWKNSIDKIESSLKKTPVVAVVDMGIDLTHPELEKQLHKNLKECQKNGMAVGGVKRVKGGDPYPGDCHGWNFAALEEIYLQFPDDDTGHGSHVSGIISASKNNKNGTSGVSDKIKILPIKVTGRVDTTKDKKDLLMSSPSKRIANGILYAVKRGVDVINLSLGWPKTMDTKFMRQVIAQAVSKDIIVVAASGNNNTTANIYPCAYFDVICVGSINIDGNMSEFSNYGGEVDILAPGDQIVSTIPVEAIPLKLNIQGYEIKTGTSMAAPFVSAAAALLKGAFPGIKKEEVMRRLYDSAMDKKQNFKSLHGNMQLGKAFELKAAPSVKPIFKNLSELVFNAKTGEFTVVLNIKNIGSDTKNVKVKISSVDGSLLFKNNEYLLLELKDYKPQALRVEGRVTNRMVDMLTKIRVEVELEDGTKSEYFQNLTISKSIEHVRAQNIGFKFTGKNLPIATIKDGVMTDNLRTVSEVFPDGDLPTYAIKYQEKNNKGLKVHFFNEENGFYQQSSKDFVQEDAIELISIIKGDFNYDGVKDLLIKTFVRNEDEDFILYSYRTIGLEPLVGEFSDIVYKAQIALVNPLKLRYQKTKLDNGSYLATEIFLRVGALPRESQVFNPWEKIDKSIIERPYNMVIEKINGRLEYKLRSFYNRDFLKNSKQSLSSFTHKTVAFDTTKVELMNFKTQSREDYYNNLVSLYFSYGVGYYRTNFILNLKDDDREIEVVDFGVKIENSDVMNNFIMSNTKGRVKADTFVQYLTNIKLSMTTYQGESPRTYVFDLETRDDLIQSFLAMFEDEKTTTSFLESVDYIVVANINKETGEIKSSKRKTKKFSFLPGVIMSEIFYPITIRDQSKLSAAIYVDSTRISGNQIYVNMVHQDKLIAPAHLSLNVPRYCTTKNPIINKSGFFRYTLVCSSKKGFFMKFIDLSL